MKERKNIPIDKLDEIVTRYGFDLRIVAPKSTLWDKLGFGAKFSDTVISHDSAFFVKGIASKEYGFEHSVTKHWSLMDTDRFYQENKIWERFPFSKVLDTRSYLWYLGDRHSNEHYMSILEYRWDNGLAFTDYQRRIEIMIERNEIEIAEKAEQLTKEVEASLAAKALLNMDLENLPVTGQISERLQNVLEGVAPLDDTDPEED